MAQIKNYVFTPASVQVYPAIWDDQKKQFQPIKSLENHDMYEVLDSITLAVEAGITDSHNWPQQLFANQRALEDFLELLSEYDDCFRISDRWAMALAHLVKSEDCEEDPQPSQHVQQGSYAMDTMVNSETETSDIDADAAEEALSCCEDFDVGLAAHLKAVYGAWSYV